MRYYKLKYVSNSRDWDSKSYMWKIEVQKDKKGEIGILEHEKFHVRQWWYTMLVVIALSVILGGLCSPLWLGLILASPLAHKLLYSIRIYRKMSEISAYRIQLDKGRYADPQFAVNALTTKHDLRMSERDARKALRLD